MHIDSLARYYRWIEYCAFARALERRRFAFLYRLKDAKRILILGEGDGRALVRLLSFAPTSSAIDVVEVSGEMIALASARVDASPNVTFIQADARTLQYAELRYDAVVTCFFLDCFPEAEAHELVNRLAAALVPNGVWLMSDFAVPASGWRRWHAKIWLAAMYRFFRITTGLRTKELPPIGALLRGAGMVRIASQQERSGMLVSEVWEKPSPTVL